MNLRLKRTSAKAFTLIELMLAMGIFAGIMAGIYASWYTIIRGSKSGLEAAANVQRARIVGTADEASALLGRLEAEGELSGHDSKPETGEHVTRIYTKARK